jgi:hypothetical protein
MTRDECADAICDVARALAEYTWSKVGEEDGPTPVQAAEVLEKCSAAVREQRFGPQGGQMLYNYNQNYRQWAGYRPPGFAPVEEDT